MAYFVENEYGEDVMLVTHEFSSIFHDTIFTEGYLIEGKLGPDHPGSLGMKTYQDFNKKREKKRNDKYKEINQERNRVNRIAEHPFGKYNGRSKKDYENKGEAVKFKDYNSALEKKYRRDGKSKYIEGSDKDKKADQRLDNAGKHLRADSVTLGSHIDRHNRRHPDRKIGESSFLDIDLL